MLAFHQPILTQQKKAPWSWLILANLVWFATLYSVFATSVGLPLTMLRFTDDTRLIAFVTSVGGLMGIVIGPLCNFISDRLWTRWGRRRPFLLVAMLGTFVAMALTPYMPSLVPLVLLTVMSSLLGDVGSTLEPLWLEIIPPEQRGRGFVLRTVMMQLASLYFFQIMFAQWDNRYTYDFSALGLGMVHFNGEQLTYMAAAFLKLFVIIFLTVLVREVHPEGVQLRSWRELDFNPVRFAKDFFLQVFGDKRWWPIYLFYVAPGIMGAGAGTFANLMQVDQWHYPKPAMALMGLPPMLVGIFLAAPMLGRQSDRFHCYPRWGLLAVITAGLAACAAFIRLTYVNLPPMELPPLWSMGGISVSLAAAGMALVFLITQELNQLTPSQNKRLWPWLLGPTNTFLWSAITLWYLRVYLHGQPPPIAHWYLLTQLTACTAVFTTLAGPLLYEFMPGDKIGTLSSGFGMISTAIGSIMANVMGFWIFYFTQFFGSSTGGKDYTASYLAILITGPISLGLMIYFMRQVRQGKIVEYGRLKLNSDGHPILAGKPAEH